MEDLLKSAARANGGHFTTSDAANCGLGLHELRSLVRAKTCHRLRRDLYVFAADWPARPEDRHGLLARGILSAYKGRIAPSHHTALILLGRPTWGVPYERPTFVRVDGSHTEASRGLRVGAALWPDALHTTSDGRAVKPALAALQIAMTFGLEAGVVALDGILAKNLTDRGELADWLQRLAGRQHRSRAVAAAALADARSESPGESRLRVRLGALGFGHLEPQVVIRVGSRALGRVDLYDRERRVAVEFDGALKYAGPGGHRVLLAEKAREDELRSHGVGFVRFVWRDLERPAVLRKKMLRAFGVTARTAKTARPA
jgi:hypothetical protein